MSINNPFKNAKYIMGAARLEQLPVDAGIEVAFAGRSNAGKSSALNALCQQKNLARTSKTPGRTQLINLFEIAPELRLVDLPGYGFAKVSQKIKQEWQYTLSLYLQQRQCLRGIVILSDIRHPLKEIDEQLIHWAAEADLPAHILLSKADKLKSGAQKSTLLQSKQRIQTIHRNASVQTFSALKGTGLDTLKQQLNQWYQFESQ